MSGASVGAGADPPENADGADGFADLKEIVVGPPGQAREEMQLQSAACAFSVRCSDVHSASCPCCLAGAFASSSRYRASPAAPSTRAYFAGPSRNTPHPLSSAARHQALGQHLRVGRVCLAGGQVHVLCLLQRFGDPLERSYQRADLQVTITGLDPQASAAAIDARLGRS